MTSEPGRGNGEKAKGRLAVSEREDARHRMGAANPTTKLGALDALKLAQ